MVPSHGMAAEKRSDPPHLLTREELTSGARIRLPRRRSPSPTASSSAREPRASLAGELARLGVSRPLVVTDPGLVASGLVDEVVGPIGVGRSLFDGVQANPTEDDVLAGLDRLSRRAAATAWSAWAGAARSTRPRRSACWRPIPGRLADYDLTTGRARPDHARPAADGRRSRPPPGPAARPGGAP